MKIQKTLLLACIASVAQIANLYAQKPTEVKAQREPYRFEQPCRYYYLYCTTAVRYCISFNLEQKEKKG